MKRILLINPLTRNHEYFFKKKKAYKLPPISLLQIGAYIKEKGYDVSILDGFISCDNKQDFLREIKKAKPELIGMTCMSTNFLFASDLSRIIKKRFPEIILVIGGSHITYSPIDIKETRFDYGIIGDGEDTFLDLLTILSIKKDVNDLPGLVIKKGNKITTTSGIVYNQDLDKYPVPDYSLLTSLEDYPTSIINSKDSKGLTIITSRGCPFRCIYCTYSKNNRPYVTNSANYVIEEIKTYTKKHGVKNFSFGDDNFMHDKERVKEICKKIIENKLDISWSCQARANTIDKELLDLIKKAGCWQISFGIETGDKEILKIIKKGTTNDIIIKAINLTHKAGIRTKGFFIIGLPGDTKESIRRTINFAKSLPLDIAIFFLLSINKGTTLYDMFESYGKNEYLEDAFIKQSDNIFVPKGLTKKYLIKQQKRAFIKFYLRPGYIIRQLLRIRSFRELMFTTRSVGKILFRTD